MGAHDRMWISDGVFAYLRRKRSLEALAQSTSPRHLALAVAVRDFGHSVRELEPAINAARCAMARGIQGAARTSAAARGRGGRSRLAMGAPGRALGAEERAALARAWQIAGAARPARQRAEDDARGGAGRAAPPKGRRSTPRPTRRSACASTAGRRSRATRWLADGRLEVQDEGSQLIGSAGRAAAQRHGRRFLRRRRRQDAAARRDDALAGAPVRVRHRREAACASSRRAWRGRDCRTCIRS